MSVQDLTTIENLKGWLPINTATTSDDNNLTRLITAVSVDFMRATHRPDLLQADYTEVREGDGSKRLIVYHWPLVSIASLQVGAATIAESADKVASGYYIDQDIDPERVWNIYLIGSEFADGSPVKIAYSAGYVQPGTPGPLTAGQVALPGDIEQAVIDWCAYRYKMRPNVGINARRSTEGESNETELLDAPPNVLQVIERYKRCLPSIDRRGDERAERLAKPFFARSAGKHK